MREGGYVTLAPSTLDRREKLVRPTARAHEYLAAHRHAVSEIDRRIRTEVGEEAFDAARQLLDALASPAHPRMSEYLHGLTHYL
jgi:DNA-binding MarR family transcriptional regulator